MAITNYLCIGCPLGCHLEVEHDGDEILEVRGHSCKRGKEFAAQEHTDPRRMLTTTVRIDGGLWPKIPVKTKAPIPKAMVIPVCNALHNIRLNAPCKMGEVVLADALGTGVDIVATRDMPPQLEG